jgi:hypothetical protein
VQARRVPIEEDQWGGMDKQDAGAILFGEESLIGNVWGYGGLCSAHEPRPPRVTPPLLSRLKDPRGLGPRGMSHAPPIELWACQSVKGDGNWGIRGLWHGGLEQTGLKSYGCGRAAKRAKNMQMRTIKCERLKQCKLEMKWDRTGEQPREKSQGFIYLKTRQRKGRTKQITVERNLSKQRQRKNFHVQTYWEGIQIKRVAKKRKQECTSLFTLNVGSNPPYLLVMWRRSLTTQDWTRPTKLQLGNEILLLGCHIIPKFWSKLLWPVHSN